MKKTISTAKTTTVRTRNFKIKTRTTTTTTEVIVEEEPMAPAVDEPIEPTPAVEVKEEPVEPTPAVEAVTAKLFYEVMPERYGWGEFTLGGGTGKFEKVVTSSELLDALRDPNVFRIDVAADINLNDAELTTSSNKTVISSNGSILRNLRWRIKAENILLMNLFLTESKDDLITLDGARNIYIKNCTFDSQFGLPYIKHPKTPNLGATEEEVKEALKQWATMDRTGWEQNVIDGQIDIINSKNVTIDSCLFANHDKVSLVRSGTDNLSIINTVYRNTFQRGPQSTGKVHFANNVYEDVKYGMRSIEEGNYLAEGNMFFRTERINRNSTSHPTAYGQIRNSFTEDCKAFDQPLEPPLSLLWEPYQFYNFEVKTPSKELAAQIIKNAGQVLHL